MAGVLGLKLYTNSISVPIGATCELPARRGLVFLYTSINNGNIVMTINGQDSPGLHELSNNTQGAITLDNSGSYLRVSNSQHSVITIFNANTVYDAEVFMLTICL